MKTKLAVVAIFFLAAAVCLVAQEKGDMVYRTGGVGVSASAKPAPVLGAPYSATITIEHIQTLADGNRIVQTSTGTTARDSQGRTRRDSPLPMIGNMSAESAPHIVMIDDPVAQKWYMLNLTEKSARVIPSGGPADASFALTAPVEGAPGKSFFFESVPDGPEAPAAQVSTGNVQRTVTLQERLKISPESEHARINTEDLGTQVIEGVTATGTRITRTIPAGAIGNEKPISVVTEVWTSPDLHTVVMSKRNDPRSGEQTFRLTNIVQGEPDPSLFTVPSDFKLAEAPQTFIYRSKQ